jgi:lipid-A-disaccharide synthase
MRPQAKPAKGAPTGMRATPDSLGQSSCTTIYFVAGEPSADNHGAALMRALRKLDPDVHFIGRGGPQMREVAGPELENWMADAAVLGLWEVLAKYGYFRRQFRETLREIGERKPDAVILMDYPGFNLRLAEALRKQSAGPKIIYYISPQLWAWNRGRIRNMSRFIDLVLCIFPFEIDLYKRAGLSAVFVGHPMIERLQEAKLAVERDPNLIGLFPGSRSREVRKIFPIMLETTRLLSHSNSQLRFEVAAASEALGREIDRMLAPRDRQIIQIKIGRTLDIMQRAAVGIIASGSATLEAAYFRMPFVLVYKVAWLTYAAARAVVRVRFLGMPNVLADREVVPEFIQHRANPRTIARAAWQLRENVDARQRMSAAFDEIIGQLGEGGASEKAASAILAAIREHSSLGVESPSSLP